MRKYLLILLLSGFAAFAQKGTVHTSIDTTKNKVGARFTLSLKAVADTSVSVVFPRGKNIGPLEVIRSYPVDTVRKDATYELTKRYGLTQFDSGRYVIPRLPVKFGIVTAFSDSLVVEVANVQVDTLKQKMHDIKDILPAKSRSGWWWYLLLVAVLAAGGYFGYKWWKRRRQKASMPEEVYKTPIEKATVLLQQLEKKELVRRGEVKTYYSELTDNARTYIEEAIHIPAMESTTAELIEKLKMASVKKHMTLTPETVANLEKVLRHADMVKFAKERPQEFEIVDDRQKIEATILTINNAIPERIEEDEDAERNELLRLAREKEKRRKRIRRAAIFTAATATAVLLLLFTLAQLGFTNIFSSPNERLLNGEWVQSEYGNPGVSIETPEVLTRIDATKMLAPDAIAILKEFQMFGMGAQLDDLYVLVSTIKYKKDTELNLDTIVEGSIRDLEQKGATNILVKKDEFATKAGISGIRAYGTMSVVDGVLKRNSKVYYEMLFFKQEQGLQQVLVWYPEGDESGQKILERVINSVELQMGAQ